MGLNDTQEPRITLPKAWINLGKTERTLGITYVALSRVKQLFSLVIEPMTFDRLKQIKNSSSLKYRQEEERRLKNLCSFTKKKFFPQF